MDHQTYRSWTLRLPVALIVLSLVALVVVPLMVRQKTGSLATHRDHVAQPARDLVNTVQRSLAREMGALRGFVITEDEAFLDRYEQALREERGAYEELEPLVAELDLEVAVAFRDLKRRADRWHGRVTEAEILRRQLVAEEFISRVRSEEVLYEETLAAAEALRERIVAEVERNRRAIEAMERTSLIVTALLALLAGAAAIVALWLGRRLRVLAIAAQRRREEAEQMGEDRARLIRGITHNLKNPLGGARGHLQLLEAGIIDDPARQRDSLDRADRAIGTALDIIQDLLDLSKAESGELLLSREPVRLGQVVRETVQDQRGAALKAGLTLTFHAVERLPTVTTDPRRVREIVRNLISNALKYTPRGGTVGVRVRPGVANDESGHECVAVDVIDTGPGVAMEDRDRIFQEFLRLDAGADAAAGSGLGLAISRHIARLLGGDVTVSSSAGEGSTFTLRLPAQRSDRP